MASEAPSLCHLSVWHCMQVGKEQQLRPAARPESLRAVLVAGVPPGWPGGQDRGRHSGRAGGGHTGASTDLDLMQLMVTGELPF